MLGNLLGPGRRQREQQQAKLAASESQTRRTLERLREQNIELQAQLDATGQRQTRAAELLKQSHQAEMSALEDELRLVRRKLAIMMDVSAQGNVISGTSFEPTQFDETP
jgi:CTP-dependent riboflavin kinase